MRSYVQLLAFVLFVGEWRTSLSTQLQFVPQDSLYIIENECANVTLHQNENVARTFEVDIKSLSPETATVTPTSLREYSTWSHPIEMCGRRAGRTTIIAIVADHEISSVRAYVPVFVCKGHLLQVMSDIFGWAYFLSWSVSSYPQMYLNYSRKSVVGLSFDYVVLTFTGHVLYSLYNCGMYFSTEIQLEYFHSHPTGTNPVMLNDVAFSLYEILGYLYIIYQCCNYERGAQTVSWKTKYVVLLIVVTFIVSAVLAAYTSILQWLDVLQYSSYIKLIIVATKYIPQAISNYRRKSTIGWSIVYVMLGFTGGVFCILQMVINSYNYNDWGSVFGNLTKFGMALTVVVFSVFFMYQHYVLYRSSLSPYMYRDWDESSDDGQMWLIPLPLSDYFSEGVKRADDE